MQIFNEKDLEKRLQLISKNQVLKNSLNANERSVLEFLMKIELAAGENPRNRKLIFDVSDRISLTTQNELLRAKEKQKETVQKSEAETGRETARNFLSQFTGLKKNDETNLTFVAKKENEPDTKSSLNNCVLQEVKKDIEGNITEITFEKKFANFNRVVFDFQNLKLKIAQSEKTVKEISFAKMDNFKVEKFDNFSVAA
jgi:hypothetical protein